MRLAGALLLAAASGWWAGVAPAGAQTGPVALSPDVTVDLSGTTLHADRVGEDDLAGTVQQVSLGVPHQPGWDVTGYHRNAVSGNLLLVLSLPSGLSGDVLLYDGSGYSVAFDVSSVLGPGIQVDAVAVSGTDLLLSFETTVHANGLTAGDEDLLRFDGASFSLELDASLEGIDPALDLDAAHLDESTGELFLSFDGSGMVDGVGFDDEDVLAFDPSSGTWQLAYDGSLLHAGWFGGDLDALSLPPNESGFDGIFADGFESGDTSAWSAGSP